EAEQYYLVTFDASGASSSRFSLHSSAVAAADDAESEPDDDMQSAYAGTPPTVIVTASLASETDEDWYSIEVSSDDIGKSVHVTTFGDDALTDTVVDVLDADGYTLGGPSIDRYTHEDFVSEPVYSEGTYYVRVYASPTFDPAHKVYSVAIRLE